jgi:hypothetical protein
MSVISRPRTWSVVTFALALVSGVALGREFIVRPVSDFGGQPIASSAVPLTVAGDRLVLSAMEGGQPRMYSTDGDSVALINETVIIRSTLASSEGLELAKLGSEVFFRGDVPAGTRLFATDGTTVRQIDGTKPNGDQAASPQEFELLNGNLVVTGLPDELFHTDGTTIGQFNVRRNLNTPTARVGNRLVFEGIPTSGGGIFTYSTDGQTLSTVTTASGQTLTQPRYFSPVGNDLYFSTGGLSNPDIYRTSDGVVAEKVASFSDFGWTNSQHSIFGFQGNLYFQFGEFNPLDVEFFKLTGGVPEHVLTWPLTSAHSTTFSRPPLYVDEGRAYFPVVVGISMSLYAFDGDSIDQVLPPEMFINGYEFVQLEGRTFLNTRSAAGSVDLYELIDSNLLHLGPGLDSMILFQGELFGANTPGTLDPTILYRTENGKLVPLGEFDNDRGSSPPRDTHFVEFGGQLYFSASTGGQTQLFAVSAVPEPTGWASFAVIWIVAAIGRRKTP